MKLPAISGQELIKALCKNGFEVVSQKGSHVKLAKNLQPVGRRVVIVPNHKTLKPGTLKSILKQSCLSLEKLLQNL